MIRPGIQKAVASMVDRRFATEFPALETTFERVLRESGATPLSRGPVKILQLNIGRRCNLACHHCHVESGPKRVEMMTRKGVERVLEILAANSQIELLDITGGAPEMNEHFRFLVREGRELGKRVIDRCNLTILDEVGQEGTAAFLASEHVEIVASLPCYTAEKVDSQRGAGVHSRSIEILQKLNTLGYGLKGSNLVLDLVYNPVGPVLPPSQAELERIYRIELHRLFGIEFHRLITITNMPIKRFAHALLRDGELEAYMSLLVNHFNPETVHGVMCRDLLSVGYDGRIYDCDFNQMLELDPLGPDRTIWEINDLSVFEGRPIATGSHCFGCTAGAGSSCSGAVLGN